MQMLQIPAFTTFNDAYLAVLRHVSDEHEHRNAPRGNAAGRILGLNPDGQQRRGPLVAEFPQRRKDG
jgi:hypothetical protein